MTKAWPCCIAVGAGHLLLLLRVVVAPLPLLLQGCAVATCGVLCERMTHQVPQRVNAARCVAMGLVPRVAARQRRVQQGESMCWGAAGRCSSAWRTPEGALLCDTRRWANVDTPPWPQPSRADAKPPCRPPCILTV